MWDGSKCILKGGDGSGDDRDDGSGGWPNYQAEEVREYTGCSTTTESQDCAPGEKCVPESFSKTVGFCKKA